MVLPISDQNPTRRTPFVNWTLVAANIGVFFGLMFPLEGCELLQFVYRWSAIPQELLTLQPIEPGAIPDDQLAECVRPIAGDKIVPLSAITAMFLHADILHLGFNMLFLWIFGNNVEDDLGHLRYLGFYLVGGLIATAAFTVVYAGSGMPLIGASGAVAAVLGAYLILHPRARVHTYVPFPIYLLTFLIPRARITGFFLIFAIMNLPAWSVLLIWFGTELARVGTAEAAGVAYEAHVAGFVAGMVIVLLLGGRPQPEPGTRRRRARSGRGGRW
jgi:membrane associated rhomboid family serine protease